ncbi:hypothetical protein ABPG75_006611 [Micractinium tetrahymenae]
MLSCRELACPCCLYTERKALPQDSPRRRRVTICGNPQCRKDATQVEGGLKACANCKASTPAQDPGGSSCSDSCFNSLLTARAQRGQCKSSSEGAAAASRAARACKQRRVHPATLAVFISHMHDPA